MLMVELTRSPCGCIMEPQLSVWSSGAQLCSGLPRKRRIYKKTSKVKIADTNREDTEPAKPKKNFRSGRFAKTNKGDEGGAGRDNRDDTVDSDA